MSKKLWLGWGTVLSVTFFYFLICRKHKQKIKKELYGAMQRTSLSIIAKRLINPFVKKILVRYLNR